MQWYKAKIKSITQGGLVEVQYFDGEVDDGLARHNLKPFKPYAVGDIIEIDQQGEFVEAKVTQRLNDNRLMVQSRYFQGEKVVGEMGVKRTY